MENRITKDLLTYLPGKLLPGLAAFITVPIYTRLFSPAEFGNYTLAIAASEFFLLGTATGFGQAAVRFFSRYKLKSDLAGYFATVFGSVAIITLAATIIWSGIMAIFRSFIPADLYPLLWGALVLFVVGATSSTLMDVLRGQEKGKWYSILWIGQSYGGIILGLVLVLVFGFGIEGLIWGQILGLLISIIPLLWLTTHAVRVSVSNLHWPDLKQLWAFALPFTIGNIAFWSLSLADRYIIEVVRGSYEVGLYSVATKISSKSIQLLASLFFLVPAPIISRLWEEQGRKATEEALTSFTRIFLLMIFPAVTGLIVIASPLIKVLADEAYYDGYQAIWLVSIAAMALGLSDLGSSGSLVQNRSGIIARNQCLAAVAGLILNITLIPKLGFIGAAISAASAFSLLAVLQAISSARFLTWHWPVTTLWRVLMGCGALAGAVLLLQLIIPTGTTAWLFVNLVLSITIGMLVYGAVLWVFGEISPKQILMFFKPISHQSSKSPIVGEMKSKI